MAAGDFNTEVRDKEVVTAVSRISDTQISLTFSPAPLYDIAAQETVTHTIPGSILTGAVDIIATPTFTLDPVAVNGAIPILRRRIEMRRLA